MPTNADLAIVVMSIDGDARVADGVSSLLAQGVPVEIVVVNSGAASVRPQLAEYLDRVTLVEAKVVRRPGGTRNLGVTASSAPIVAFLAADCVAAPGWVASRLAVHSTGQQAVASALRPAPDASGAISSASWATYALLHVRRAPEYPRYGAARYGASYDRSLFARHGLFREDLRIGEDTEFNARIAKEAAPYWAPEVVTLHHYPKSTSEGIREAFDRGRNVYRWFANEGRLPLVASIRRTTSNWLVAQRLARLTTGEVRTALRRAGPQILLFALAYAAGAVGAAWSPRNEQQP